MSLNDFIAWTGQLKQVKQKLRSQKYITFFKIKFFIEILARITLKHLLSLLHICRVSQTLQKFIRQKRTVRRINKTPRYFQKFQFEIVKVGIYESGGYETLKWAQSRIQ